MDTGPVELALVVLSDHKPADPPWVLLRNNTIMLLLVWPPLGVPYSAGDKAAQAAARELVNRDDGLLYLVLSKDPGVKGAMGIVRGASHPIALGHILPSLALHYGNEMVDRLVQWFDDTAFRRWPETWLPVIQEQQIRWQQPAES